MGQVVAKQSSYDDIISCPVFRTGYDHFWHDRAWRNDASWTDDELISYKRGRQFGAFAKLVEGERIPLMKGGLPYYRARALLFMALRSGDVI